MRPSPGSRIRVLMVGPSPRIVGGQSVQLQQVKTALEEYADVDLSFHAIDPPLPAAIRRVPGLRTVAAWLRYVPSLAVKVLRCDVVHAFTAAYWGYYLWILPAWFFARLFGRKIVVNYRDGQAADHLRNWRFAQPTLARMDALVVPSGFLVDVFAPFSLQAQVIHNIVEPKRFTYRARRVLQPIVLHNRGLEPLYNVSCALRAFRRIQDRFPDARFIIAHDGPLRGALEAEALALGLNRCEFIGAQSHQASAALYDQADIYVMTPNIDNMPSSLLECAVSGVPIVSTRAGGVPYIVTDGESALLTDLDDDAAIAAHCIRLLEDPDLVERLTARARADVQQYTAPVIAGKWMHLYQSLVEGSATALSPRS